jgi:UDP-N-acetylglucosamine--N-acetylmuramyl-(pentapeptide) pyrophosphoryl-undecaprenol N-acetylglucosamine transferase
LVEKNATVLIKDQDAKANLVKEIISLCFDEMRKEQLSNNIKVMAKPNAAKDIASLALSIIEQKN